MFQKVFMKVYKEIMRKNKYLIMVLLCVIVCCNFSGCGRLNFLAPEKKMESYLERKYDEDFEYVEGSLSGSSDSAYTFVWDTTGYTAEFISEENPDIVVTCGYGDDFSDTYRDELFRKQFKELMYEYSSEFFTGEYYVWIAWDERTEPIDENQNFEEYIKDDPRFYIYIYVEDMNKEEATEAGKKFVEKNESLGIKCSTYVGKNIGYDHELFKSWMEGGSKNFSHSEDYIERYYVYSYIEKYRQQFKDMITEYSKDFYTGEYYVWIECKKCDRVGKASFEEYIKNPERFDIYIFVIDMNDEDASRATSEFKNFLSEKGIRNQCWGARNCNYDIEEFRKIMTEGAEDFDPAFYRNTL